MKWLKKIYRYMTKQGRAKSGSELDALHTALFELKKYKKFVQNELSKVIEVRDEIFKIIKNNGISKETVETANKVLKKLPETNQFRFRMYVMFVTVFETDSQAK